MTPAQFLPVAAAAIVAVLIDGSFVPSAPPASLRAGRVVGPLELVARFADRIEPNAGRTLVARRGERACIVRPVGAGDPVIVELAPLARCLGAHVAWDPRGKSLQLSFNSPVRVRTPAPFDPNAPQAVPTTVFTPEPAPPTPRVIATGSPRPRRTAIPVTPSWPLTTPRP